jgi:6-phosphogluconolactonase
VDELTGGLKLLNKVDSEGAGPCALGIDPHGRTLCVADYAGGAFAAFPLSADGSIGAAGSTLRCKDNAACGTVGPVSDRQDMAHLHCAVFSPDGGFVLVCDLGDDAIEVLPVVAPGRTGMAQRVQARRGSGPRHIAFHPSGKWFYCIHELDCTIDIYDWKRTKGGANATLREGSSISTLAAGTALKGNTGCELQVSRDGRFVTACTRGVDEITVYAIDRETGTLSEQQRVSSGGTIPRYIALDPSERWLVCTNQGAATTGQGACVTVFARDTGSGRLDAKAQTFAAPTPMFVAWI